MKATNEDIRKIEKGQERTIDRAVTDEITVVWGPPGTGKTHTMSRIAIEQMRKGKKVLIASHSNISVDGVIKKIVELLEDEGTNAPIRAGKILRYGYMKDDLLKRNRYASSYNFTVMHKPVLKEEEIGEMYGVYPDAHMIDPAPAPAYALWARDVINLSLRSWHVTPEEGETRPEILFTHCIREDS